MTFHPKIVLIGMPGSGKTTLGKQLALEIGCDFFDLDELIEREVEVSIKRVFEERGETEFRKLESAQLRSFVRSHNRFVLASGGGTPCFHDNMTFIRGEARSVYLSVSVETLVKRLEETGDSRPLVKTKGRELRAQLSQQLAARSKYYEMADLTLEEGQPLSALRDRLASSS